MKYYTGGPADLQKHAAEALGELLFGASDGPTGDPTPVTFLSDPDKLAALKAELDEKLLQNKVFRSALGRTRTCDLLIRSRISRVLTCPDACRSVA